MGQTLQQDTRACNQMTFSQLSQLIMKELHSKRLSRLQSWVKIFQNGYGSYGQGEMALNRVFAVAVRIQLFLLVMTVMDLTVITIITKAVIAVMVKINFSNRWSLRLWLQALFSWCDHHGSGRAFNFINTVMVVAVETKPLYFIMVMGYGHGYKPNKISLCHYLSILYYGL